MKPYSGIIKRLEKAQRKSGDVKNETSHEFAKGYVYGLAAAIAIVGEKQAKAESKSNPENPYKVTWHPPADGINGGCTCDACLEKGNR